MSIKGHENMFSSHDHARMSVWRNFSDLLRYSCVCWFQKDHDTDRQKWKHGPLVKHQCVGNIKDIKLTCEDMCSIHYTSVNTGLWGSEWLKHTIFCIYCEFLPSAVRPADLTRDGVRQRWWCDLVFAYLWKCPLLHSDLINSW